MEKKLKKYNELTADELYDIMKLRVDVFVVEQNCPYHELDGLDKIAYHLWLEDSDGIAAYLRILPPGAAFGDPALGRVISARRRCGVGSVLLNEGIEAVRKYLWPFPAADTASGINGIRKTDPDQFYPVCPEIPLPEVSLPAW